MPLFGKKKSAPKRSQKPAPSSAEARTDKNTPKSGTTQRPRQPPAPKADETSKKLKFPKKDAPPSALRVGGHSATGADHGPSPSSRAVRFAPGGDQSVASLTHASVPHMMVGAGSVASSSAMSSNDKLNKVMDEEYRRLNAMGMGFD